MTIDACAAIVEKADPDRFLATMAAPVAARRVLFPIYAFNVEVARAPWVTAEPMIAEMRLQWWRDALQEISARGVVRQHEVVTPLAHVLDQAGAELLDQLIAARRWDIHREPFEDDGHFCEYLDRTSGNLLLAAARALGDVDEVTLRHVGYAMGLANWLRAVPALEAAGRIPLVDGRPEAIGALAAEGAARLALARSSRRKISTNARPAMLVGWQSGTILTRAQNTPALVARGGLESSPLRQRLGLMMRAATGRW